MLNERYYSEDARTKFLAPESVDLFLTHLPYFDTHSDAYGNPERQLQNTSNREKFVAGVIEAIKHMEFALKPNGTILIGFPTDQNLYKIIEKINTDTSLKYGPIFLWDYAKSPHVLEVTGVESTVFLNLHKGHQFTNMEYKIDSYTLSHPWIVSDFLKSKDHIAFVTDSAPDLLYERMLLRYSKPGDVVADIFGGTGEALRVAKRHSRQTVYNDVSESQCRLARIVIDDEKETPLDTKKKEAITLMTKEIQDMNKAEMQNLNMTVADQEQYLANSYSELNRINGLLVNMLVKNGVIR
jgi:DNA modification methylase